MAQINLLALDASTRCTGYSQFHVDFDAGTFSHVLTDSIKSSKKELYSRFEIIDKSLRSSSLYSWADTVVFENYAFKGNRIAQLAELNGVLKYQFFLSDTDIEILAPNTIKKLVTGHGHAKKPVVALSLSEVDEFKHIEFKNEDESDSLAVGYAFILKTLQEKELLENDNSK